ncbi:hypothetical protein NUW58_g464 [Xylaria curta]|uniref:Uncharacterized protein n=1 Tax=Xylaria curta TaxID=42375 RepID=A0ACC1PRQ0_9PEZI|nr:hypothetical protein NUW58_g464 [Xylaria curta]
MSSLAITEVEHSATNIAARTTPATDGNCPGGPARCPSPHAQETVVDGVVVQHYPSGAQLWLVLLTMGAVLVITCIDMNIVATAVPSITDHFHTVADVGWYSSAFRLSVSAFQFVFGKAYTLFSVKRLFLVANAISIVGSILCGAATTSTMLVVGRAVAGLGSAGIFSGCFVILVQSTPLHRRPIFLGVVGGIEGVGYSDRAAPWRRF